MLIYVNSRGLGGELYKLNLKDVLKKLERLTPPSPSPCNIGKETPTPLYQPYNPTPLPSLCYPGLKDCCLCGGVFYFSSNTYTQTKL